ncbi:MAG: NAD(P)-dependent glycerol-3-phosphate dehydrogenase [Fimbriimonadaceae bacterium]|nr:NAD(P)-dependent glycerol-3-phosphate dehydrogenase [Fimbriimonadaceae bacterium]
MPPLAVVGAGSWGTALAWLLASSGRPVRLWGRDATLVAELRAARVNRRYLPEAELPASVQPTADLAAAVAHAELVVVAVPSVGVPALATALATTVAPGALVVSATKGLDHQSGQRMTTVLATALGPRATVAALSGPNLAHEIVAGQPAASVLAAGDPAAAERAQRLLTTATFRVYRSADVAGVELGGALKNPLAIAAGIVDGLGFGDNTKATLLTRGMHEVRRLGVALGADERTFAGLCGLGDLLATCQSRQSRNRNLGEQLGRGRALADLLAATSQVAEGVPTCRTALRLAAAQGIEMPILSQLQEVLFAGKPAAAAARDLMLRDVTEEWR